MTVSAACCTTDSTSRTEKKGRGKPKLNLQESSDEEPAPRKSAQGTKKKRDPVYKPPKRTVPDDDGSDTSLLDSDGNKIVAETELASQLVSYMQ